MKTSLEHYSGDYQTYQNTLAEKKVVQARARVAYEKEKEKLKGEWIVEEVLLWITFTLMFLHPLQCLIVSVHPDYSTR